VRALTKITTMYSIGAGLLAIVVAIGLTVVPCAMAAITEGHWKVNTKELVAKGEEEQYILKSNTKFTFTGEVNKVKFKIECTGAKILGMALILGGNPGINSESYGLEGCTVAEPEKAECEVLNKEVTINSVESEIVENGAMAGQSLLLFKEVAARFGSFLIESAPMKNCKIASCPGMLGSVLANVSNENAENKEMTITFSSALIKYVKVDGTKPVASLQIGELTPAEFSGSITVELTTKDPFGVFIK
jgi:hypothetical protein